MTREEIKQRNRSNILSSAISLFSKKGCSNTSLEEIAREAGVTGQTLLNRFGSKNELMCETLSFIIDGMYANFKAHLSEPAFTAKNGHDQYIDIIEYHLRVAQTMAEHTNAITELGLAISKEGCFDSEKYYAVPAHLVIGAMSAAIAKGKLDGSISLSTPDDYATVRNSSLLIRGLIRQIAFMLVNGDATIDETNAIINRMLELFSISATAGKGVK